MDDNVASAGTSAPPAPVGPYSQYVRSGSHVFCSGQLGIDPATGELVAGGIEPEARQAMENLKAVLAAAGTSLSRAVRVEVFLSNIDHYGQFNLIYSKYFEGIRKPARMVGAVAALPKGARVEISCIAEVD